MGIRKDSPRNQPVPKFDLPSAAFVFSEGFISWFLEAFGLFAIHDMPDLRIYSDVHKSLYTVF